MLFLGLYLMEEAVEPLKKIAVIKTWMQGLNNPWWGALIGAGVTVVLQSSSATVGMAVILTSQQLLNLSAGIALMMGAELGTCADTLVAFIGRSRAALRTRLFHLSFICCLSFWVYSRLSLSRTWCWPFRGEHRRAVNWLTHTSFST